MGGSTLATRGFDRGQAGFPQREIRNQAALRRSVQQASHTDQEISPENASISNERHGLSLAFRNIPVFPPEDASQPQPPFLSRPVQFAGVQRKLEVGAVDDPLEHEADRMAAHVMRLPSTASVTPPTGMAGGISALRRKSTGPRDSSLSSSPNDSGATAPPIVHEVLRSPGHPLDRKTRSFMEERFASDFSDVRVHVDSQAAQSAAAVRARAYTVGNNVVFGAGNFAPASHEGKRLIAHELTHVLQQGATVLRRDPEKDPQPLKPSTDASEFHADEVKGNKRTYYRGEYREVPDGKGGVDREEVYWVKFNVDEKGVMTASVRTVNSDKSYRSPQLRFKDEFNKALETFKKNGVEVKEFEGDWSYMSPDEASDNLRIYQQGVKGGDTEKDAASNTPTGRVVTKAGFKIVDVRNDPEPQPHLKDEKTSFPRVRARFVRTTDQAPDGPSGGGGGGGSTQGGKTTPQVKGQGGASAPTETDVEPAGGGTGVSPKVKSQGGVSTGADVEPGVTGKTGGTAGKSTGQAPSSGRFGGVGTLALHFGIGAAAAVADAIGAYFKAKFDAKSAQKQTEAFLAIATNKINANPDEAVKKMLANPEATVYAWIHLDNSTISSLGPDALSGDPTLHTSSPLLDLGPIEYVTGPVVPELATSVPKIGGGGLAPTVTRTFIIDVPLATPPLEELIAYAKKRSMPLDDVYVYALNKFQAAASANVAVLETRVQLLQTRQGNDDTWKKFDAEYKKAEKAHDVKRQVAILQTLTSIDQSQLSISAQLNNLEKAAQQSGEKVDYWERMVNLLKPTTP
ncbi:DUF4157 domain-containing protein [Terriglobus roseus]|uniref:eCIS core domain-containing protein n=1 Tax=Terriglobus roseus TaxID=392734 RepID=UPI0018D48270|nr:DUF4157 domain-containing protein [Terriglobus roseus]